MDKAILKILSIDQDNNGCLGCICYNVLKNECNEALRGLIEYSTDIRHCDEDTLYKYILDLD